jgi:hypothetical protein
MVVGICNTQKSIWKLIGKGSLDIDYFDNFDNESLYKYEIKYKKIL